MKSLWLGMLFGFGLGGLVCFVPLWMQHERDLVTGRQQGVVAGFGRAATIIDREFGRAPRQESLKTLFTVKDLTVGVVEVNGVPTVRILD